jgi:hypothetical protein
VDDGLVACSNKQTVLEIFQYFQLESEIVWRPADYFVGLLISRDRKRRVLYLFQPTYINKILLIFNMQDCHPRTTPADPTADPSHKNLFPIRKLLVVFCIVWSPLVQISVMQWSKWRDLITIQENLTVK